MLGCDYSQCKKLCYCFFEHLKLVVHQVHENLLVLNLCLVDNLDGAWHLCFYVKSPANLSKGALADLLVEMVHTRNISNLLETLEVLEGDYLASSQFVALLIVLLHTHLFVFFHVVLVCAVAQNTSHFILINANYFY
jgi:hypothetical protein